MENVPLFIIAVASIYSTSAVIRKQTNLKFSMALVLMNEPDHRYWHIHKMVYMLQSMYDEVFATNNYHNASEN